MTLIFSAIYLTCLFFIIRSIIMTRHSISALKWPTTTGVVHFCELVEKSDMEGNKKQKHKVSYTYSVDGTEYTGDRAAFAYANLTNTKQLYDALKDAHTVLVRYNPKDHSVATLTCGLIKSNILMIVLSSVMIWILLGVNLLFWIVSVTSDAPLLTNLVINPN